MKEIKAANNLLLQWIKRLYKTRLTLEPLSFNMTFTLLRLESKQILLKNSPEYFKKNNHWIFNSRQRGFSLSCQHIQHTCNIVTRDFSFKLHFLERFESICFYFEHLLNYCIQFLVCPPPHFSLIFFLQLLRLQLLSTLFFVSWIKCNKRGWWLCNSISCDCFKVAVIINRNINICKFIKVKR